MNNVTFIKITGLDGVDIEHAIIDHGNEQFTSMLRSTYEARQAEQSTPMIPITTEPPTEQTLKGEE